MTLVVRQAQTPVNYGSDQGTVGLHTHTHSDKYINEIEDFLIT
jgi:hypothetical protein